jgi:hypothetical protein
MSEQTSLLPVPENVDEDYIQRIKDSDYPLENMADLVKVVRSRWENTKGRLNMVAANYDRKRRELESLREYLKQLIEDDEITDKDIIDTLIKEHGVEVSETLTVTISVDVTVEVTVPKGTDVDMYEFEVDGVTYQGDTVDVKDMEVQSIEIND